MFRTQLHIQNRWDAELDFWAIFLVCWDRNSLRKGKDGFCQMKLIFCFSRAFLEKTLWCLVIPSDSLLPYLLFVQAKDNKYFNFWVYCYCSSNKTDMVQLFKNIFAFIGVKFQDYSKKFESLLSICRIITCSLIQEYHFNDHFVRFQHFGLRYRILIVSSTCVTIRADSE